MNIIEQAKNYQYQIIKDYNKDPYNLISHLPEAEKWAKKILKKFPQANEKVVLLTVWLHDTGHYSGNPKIDHAVKSEELARNFLTGKVDKDLLEKVVRAVRSHRCKDVLPETLEEKIFACCDSASHMTDYVYIDILKDGRFAYAEAKMQRDFRDIGLIPEIKKELTPLFKVWKKLVDEYKKLDIVELKQSATDKV